MACRIGSYEKVRHQMMPGDVIAFAGAGPASVIIQAATRSNISHVGIVVESPTGASELLPDLLQVMESTSLDGFTGVTTSWLRDRIAGYDGRVWWLPLRDSVRAAMDLGQLLSFLLQQKGKLYDLPQAIMSGLDLLDEHALLERATHAVEDYRCFFCSELVAGALEASGAVPHLNASEVTPIDLCTFSIYSDDYWQLKGEPEAIQGYNTVSPAGWGE